MTAAQRAQRLFEIGELRRQLEAEEHRHRTYFAARMDDDTQRTYGEFVVTNTKVDKAYVAAHTRPAFTKITVKKLDA